MRDEDLCSAAGCCDQFPLLPPPPSPSLSPCTPGLEQQPLTYTLEVIILSMFKKHGEKAHESVSQNPSLLASGVECGGREGGRVGGREGERVGGREEGWVGGRKV